MWKYLHANMASDGILDTMRKQNQFLHWKFEATSDNIDGFVPLNQPNLTRRHDARHSQKTFQSETQFECPCLVGYGPRG